MAHSDEFDHMEARHLSLCKGMVKILTVPEFNSGTWSDGRDGRDEMEGLTERDETEQL